MGVMVVLILIVSDSTGEAYVRMKLQAQRQNPGLTLVQSAGHFGCQTLQVIYPIFLALPPFKRKVFGHHPMPMDRLTTFLKEIIVIHHLNLFFMLLSIEQQDFMAFQMIFFAFTS